MTLRKKIETKSILAAALVVTFAVAELLWMQSCLHRVVGDSLTQGLGFHSDDALWPILLTCFFSLIFSQTQAAIRTRPHYAALLVNVGGLGAFHVILENFNWLLGHVGSVAVTGMLVFSVFFCVVTALFISYSAKEFLRSFQVNQVIWQRSALIVLLLLLYPIIVKLTWSYLSGATAKALSVLLSSFDDTVTSGSGQFFWVESSKFKAIITISCAGFEGIFFFIASLWFVTELNPHLLSQVEKWVFGVLGLFWMFSLNVMRIAIIFLAASYDTISPGQRRSPKLFEDLFHSHFGWLIYGIGIVMFFYFVSQYKVRQFSRSARRLPLLDRDCGSNAA